MYCTPCARLTKSITPKVKVRPAAIRKSRTPSCSPFRVWTARSAKDTAAAPLLHLAVCSVAVDIVLEYALHDLGLVFAIGALGRLDEIEILDGIVVDPELELAAQGSKFAFLSSARSASLSERFPPVPLIALSISIAAS